MFGRKRIYLDYAAAARSNPSSPHAEGREAKRVLEDARTSIARLTETKPDDVIFTSGATEANALAILGLAKPGAHVFYLPSAHASVVENMKLAEARGVIAEPLQIKDGRIDIEKLKAMLRSETILVSMDAVCGETGTIWNTREVKNAIGNAYLHVDAAQAALTEKLTRSHFGADLLVLDGGKVGARGIGVLIASRTISLAPLYGGGGQERELRSGTQNVEAAHEFAAALRAAANEREAFVERAKAMRKRLAAAVEKGIPDVHVNAGANGVPHILNLSLIGRDTDYLVALLDEAGFAVSTRSACESDSAEGSRAVFALTNDPARAESTLRISWGPATKGSDLGRFELALKAAVAFLDEHKA